MDMVFSFPQLNKLNVNKIVPLIGNVHAFSTGFLAKILLNGFNPTFNPEEKFIKYERCCLMQISDLLKENYKLFQTNSDGITI